MIYYNTPLNTSNYGTISEHHNEIPIYSIKWIIRAFRSALITGDQGCGKTTFLKSAVQYFEPWVALRVNELQPELNLRYAYPDRNIISFCEQPSVSTESGLDFQKKTTGTVNILGEIATALLATWFIKTCKVASKSGVGTHHANDPDDLITSFAMDISHTLGFNDLTSIMYMVAEAIDFDIHMAKDKDFRFLERITEITAVNGEAYPFNNLDDYIRAHPNGDYGNGLSLEQMQAANRLEFQKRLTDRKPYKYENICHYDKKKKMYVMDKMFSDDTINNIVRILDSEDEAEFFRDMEFIKKVAAS